VIYNCASVGYNKRHIDIIIREESIPVNGQEKLNKGNICVWKIGCIAFP